MLRAYGADVVVCPTAVAPDHPDSYYSVSNRLVEEIDGAWKPDQYSNPMGPASHYETTGPGDLGRHRRQGHPFRRRRRHRRHHHRRRAATSRRCPGGAGEGHRRRPRGLGVLRRHRAAVPGRGRRRGLLAVRLRPDRARRDHRGLRRRLVRDDPAAGPRGGAAGRRLVRDGRRSPRSRSPSRPDPDALVVVLLPDGGRGYLSKIFNDAWMSSYGFLRTRLDGSRASRPSATCCAASPARCPTWCTPTRRRPCATRSASCASTASRRCRSSAPSRR